MPTLTIRDLEPTVVRSLKRKAAAHHRSLEGEVRAVLEREAALPTLETWLGEAARLRSRQRTTRRAKGSAAELIRQGRDSARR